MNILPLVLGLVLVLSVLTIERLEKYKNWTVTQQQYQYFLEKGERATFNQRERALFNDYEKTLRQVTFRYFVDKKAREANADLYNQYRIITIELMKILYGEAAFYKNLERKRSHFLEEMLGAIEEAADALPEESIKRIEDISKIHLEDPELQEAFYHMLKGTVVREKKQEEEDEDPEKSDEIKESKKSKKKKKEEETLSARITEKSYYSLFTFINYNGAVHGSVKDPENSSSPKIKIQRAPREVLKAVFVSDEIVDAIIAKRNELAKNKDNGAAEAFKNEFIDKRRPGLNDQIFDFSIKSKSDSSYD